MLKLEEYLKYINKIVFASENGLEGLKNKNSTMVVVLEESGFSQYLFDLYKTYEFTDKISLFFEREQYGGIMNLLKTGILSDEEVVEAILR